MVIAKHPTVHKITKLESIHKSDLHGLTVRDPFESVETIDFVGTFTKFIGICE